MASHGWLVIPALVSLSAAAFAACSDVTTTTATASTTSSSATGGAGGAGGAPGVTASASTGMVEDAGRLTCKSHTYSTIKLGSGECDLLAQDCAEGETCKEVPGDNAQWTTHCITAYGLKSEGEVCAVDDECRAKLTCAANRCTPVCCKATNAPCLGGICDFHVQFDNSMKANKQVCHYAKACALLTADACEQGYRCYIEDDKQGLATCAQPSAVDAPDLGSCSYLNDCPDMAHCLNGSQNHPGFCHFYCDLTQVDPASPKAGLGGCPAGQTCKPTVDGVSFIVALPEIGICAPGP